MALAERKVGRGVAGEKFQAFFEPLDCGPVPVLQKTDKYNFNTLQETKFESYFHLKCSMLNVGYMKVSLFQILH